VKADLAPGYGDVKTFAAESEAESPSTINPSSPDMQRANQVPAFDSVGAGAKSALALSLLFVGAEFGFSP
jgi:hypothetical protein